MVHGIIQSVKAGTELPRRNKRNDSDDYEQLDLARIAGGFKRSEYKRGKEWHVQPISASRAIKEYACPGCSVPIAVGVPHLTVWEAEAIFGDEAALRDRRHWHSHCWGIY